MPDDTIHHAEGKLLFYSGDLQSSVPCHNYKLPDWHPHRRCTSRCGCAFRLEVTSKMHPSSKYCNSAWDWFKNPHQHQIHSGMNFEIQFRIDLIEIIDAVLMIAILIKIIIIMITNLIIINSNLNDTFEF